MHKNVVILCTLTHDNSCRIMIVGVDNVLKNS
jgi:hypothetical protein